VVNGWAEAVRLRKVGQLYHRACAWVVARDGMRWDGPQDDGMRDDGLDLDGQRRAQQRECRPARRCNTQARDKGQVGCGCGCECRARRAAAADGSWEESTVAVD
jgi:hypothetical protein